jgi:hypothetical protein
MVLSTNFCFYSVAIPPGCTNFNFEKGNLNGWIASGTAFQYQPTLGDNPKARRTHPSKHQGRYWIGTYEKHPNGRYKAGTIQVSPYNFQTVSDIRLIGKSLSGSK